MGRGEDAVRSNKKIYGTPKRTSDEGFDKTGARIRGRGRGQEKGEGDHPRPLLLLDEPTAASTSRGMVL